MQRQALLIGVLVLAARLLTFPRTPWDADELRFSFALMVAISIAASMITAVAITIAFEDPFAALLFSFSAAVMVHAPSARLDSVAWMFIALALLCVHRPALLGIFTAAAIAAQPWMFFGAIALFIAALVRTDGKGRVNATVAFALTLMPFLHAPENLPSPGSLNVVRFVLHPWGAKWVALPVLLCAAIGVRPLLRKWNPRVEVLMWFAFAHLAFGIALVDPSDGVRYAVPAMMFVALLAAQTRFLSIALCALSVYYAFPVLRERVLQPSPPIAAARAIPPHVVVLHERAETMPFAKGVLLDDGLRRYFDHPEVKLIVFADQPASPRSDAAGKLTRNAFAKIALIPVENRYAPIRGVYGVERNEKGESWRWLEREAELRASMLTLRSPIADNEIVVNGVPHKMRRGETITIPVNGYAFITAKQTFALQPPDTRQVAVQLLP